MKETSSLSYCAPMVSIIGIHSNKFLSGSFGSFGTDSYTTSDGGDGGFGSDEE